MLANKIFTSKLVRYTSPIFKQTFFSWGKGSIGGSIRDTIHKPHTSEYLAEQVNICKRYNIPAKVVELEKGAKLWSMSISGNILLGARAAYPYDSLKKLSKLELDEILSRRGNSLMQIELNETIKCILSENENGRQLYYIDFGVASVVDETSLDNILANKDLNSDVSNTLKKL